MPCLEYFPMEPGRGKFDGAKRILNDVLMTTEGKDLGSPHSKHQCSCSYSKKTERREETQEFYAYLVPVRTKSM